MLFIPAKRSGPEFLDAEPDMYSLKELEESLADIRAVNRYLGDRRALLKHLSTKAAGTESFSVLDIATGSGDLPIAIAGWARKAGIAATIVGVDISFPIIEIARKQTAGYPEIRCEVADGLKLPYHDKSFDFVLCSKTAHHMTDDNGVRLLKEILRVARRGYIIMDLRRSWIAYFLIFLLTRLCTGNRLTRYDGPLSVLKSFTPGEMAALAARAGASHFTISAEPFWRLVLAGDIT